MLHLVNKSPFERTTLQSCLRLAKKDSAVLLIEDGVYAALEGTAVSDEIAGRMSDLAFYVLGSDIAARGLSETPLIDGVQVVDYGGFVDLVAEHDATQSWL
ncbi:MAG: sulfurtransferase complex subunit TusB [Kiloniellales bacterium]